MPSQDFSNFLNEVSLFSRSFNKKSKSSNYSHENNFYGAFDVLHYEKNAIKDFFNASNIA